MKLDKLLIFSGIFVSLMVSLHSCSTTRAKVRRITSERISSTIELPEDKKIDFNNLNKEDKEKRDTVSYVDFEGRKVLLMSAVQQDGEMVAHDMINAATITARFRHYAERNGKVALEFQLIVPEEMLDNKWQLRYSPTMFILDDSLSLDKVYITGKEYRNVQLRGYQQYERFLRRIITDTTKFYDLFRLEAFIQRNIPQVYAFKNDTSFVSDERFDGLFGVSEQEAIEHYTRHYLIRRNEYLIGRKSEMFARYVKDPIITQGLRLDTVLNVNGNYVYNYIQEIDVKGKSKLKKVEIVLDGDIYENGVAVYNIPRSEPLTFYISSISAFVDGTERYIKKVIERRVEANASYNIDFAVGKSVVDPAFNNNSSEIDRIKAQLRFLLDNKVFDLDSVRVCASASPEGSVAANSALSKARSNSISSYFNSYMKRVIDSLNMEDGFEINLAQEDFRTTARPKRKPIRFSSTFIPENWEGLSKLVEQDSVLTITDKEDYYALLDIRNADEREMRMRREKWYARLKNVFYPNLRSVRFDFALHRKDMVKDTVVTTVLDSTYMRGVAAIRDRDYDYALSLLAPYGDYNTAIVYCALERNYSALQILEQLEKTAEVNYMLAILWSRLDDEQKAVQHYMTSCEQNSSFIHRGNLDPEISVLIKKYELNKEPDFDF